MANDTLKVPLEDGTEIELDIQTVTKEQLKKCEEDVSSAIFHLYLNHSFFAFLIEHVDIFATTAIPTAAVSEDGRLFVNPGFWNKQNEKQQQFLLAHEILHLALRHFVRRGNRNGRLFNMAADYLINGTLVHESDRSSTWAHSMPEGGLLAEDGYMSGNKLSELTAEEVYLIVEEEARKMMQRMGKDNPHAGQKDGGRTMDDIASSKPNPRGEELSKKYDSQSKSIAKDLEQMAQNQQMQDMIDKAIADALEGVSDKLRDKSSDTPEGDEEWKQKVAQAATRSKMAGHMSSAMEGMIGDLLEPKISWRDQYARRVTQLVCKENVNNFTFAKRNRRYMNQKIIMPSMIGTKAQAAAAVDISGSMGEYWQQAVSDWNFVRQRYGIRFYLMWQENSIHPEGWIEPNAPVPKQVEGLYGGTDFGIIFDHLKEQKLDTQIDFCTVFTDLYGSCGKWTNNPPPYKVIWVTYTDEIPPFGEVIRILT